MARIIDDETVAEELKAIRRTLADAINQPGASMSDDLVLLKERLFQAKLQLDRLVHVVIDGDGQPSLIKQIGDINALLTLLGERITAINNAAKAAADEKKIQADRWFQAKLLIISLLVGNVVVVTVAVVEWITKK